MFSSFWVLYLFKCQLLIFPTLTCGNIFMPGYSQLGGFEFVPGATQNLGCNLWVATDSSWEASPSNNANTEVISFSCEQWFYLLRIWVLWGKNPVRFLTLGRSRFYLLFHIKAEAQGPQVSDEIPNQERTWFFCCSCLFSGLLLSF